MVSALILAALLLLGSGFVAAERVAIIGGGIGGASAAYFLRDLLPDAEITV
jgi:hypothetical protein